MWTAKVPRDWAIRLATAAFASGVAPVLSARGETLLTADIGAVPVLCTQIHFVVSLNDDDDNRNGIADLRETLPLKNAAGQVVVEDNLREFDFTLPGAATVVIAAPIIKAAGQSALGARVRAYEADRKTPFKFGRRNTPVTMYFEGVGQSPTENDIGFEYAYFDTAGKSMKCGPAADGTVERIEGTWTVVAGRGSAFERHRKMLIGSAASAAVTVTQPIKPHPGVWTYDRVADGAFRPASGLATTFTAGFVFTPVPSVDLDRARVRLSFPRAAPAGQQIEVSTPVTLTAPQHLALTSKPDVVTQPSGWLNANPGAFDLINARFVYQLRDQTQSKITDSAYGGRTPQARENIDTVLTSPFPQVQAWIRTSLHSTPNWADHADGTLSDLIQAQGLQIDWISSNTGGRRSFDAPLPAGGGGVMLITPPAVHVWELSVNGEGAVGATANTFTSTVATRQHGGGTEIDITSTYEVHTP